jgi:hypothetical protein
MRNPYRFLLLGVPMFALPMVALAQDMEQASLPERRQLVSRASRLRTSDVNDPDTVWIGHIADADWRPRDRDGNPLGNPSIQTGGYGPSRVGRGEYPLGIGPATQHDGVWDFDHFGAATPAQGGFPARAAENDSLMGWWPLARPFQSGDAVSSDDRARPFYGLDYGNFGNYVINQGSPRRTFGVTGYWHRDVGRNSLPLADSVAGVLTVAGIGGVVPGPNVEWKPIGGGASAWCGLRGQGDMTHVDPITGNAYNQTILSYRGNNSFFQQGSQSTRGTDQNFPGYGSQWDQMLYQDVVLTGNAAVSVQFDYATSMSRVRGGTATQRIGYFYKDPTKTVAGNDGNFISATDAEPTLGGPVDSFMVYVGKPVNDAGCRYANGSIAPVYDLQRRWFSEVVALDAGGGLSQVCEVLSAAGVNGTMAGDGTITPVHASVSLSTTQLGALGIGAGGGTVRLLFRVKTNRGSDDEDYGAMAAFTSGTRGAAIIDNVTVTQGGENLVDFGDFESANAIDNNTLVPATAAWKSTGKPPGIFVHVHSVDPSSADAAPWNDPCGPPNFDDPSAVNRGCNMTGNVLTGGDHDNQEKPGGLFGGPTQDRAAWVASPTINLASNGSGDYNGQGIDAEIAEAADWQVWGDIHTPGFLGNVTGNFFSIGLQSYPARQANGLTVWGETRHTLTISFYSVSTCTQFAFSPKTNGLIVTSNASGIPDSVRVYVQFLSRCFTTVHDANTCSPAPPSVHTGSYVDNLSFALLDAAQAPGLSISAWSKYSDAFPATTTSNFSSANFDTCAAWIKSGVNAHVANIGLTKPSIQGDSAWVQTGLKPGIRVDMIFRILPGVGNYVQIGNRNGGLRRVPTGTAMALPSDAGNGTLTPTQRFWGAYMADNGAYGTGAPMNGTSPGPGHPGGMWDPNRWNSARMDTMETNVFPCLNLGPNIARLDPANWQTTYHESDPKFAILGIPKNRCFVVDPSLGRGTACASKTSTSVTQCNLICGTHPSSPTFPPLWTQDLTSGLAPSENGLPNGRTNEYTKIIPDGLLTPGAHVQYFYRREPGQSALIDLYPDTNHVFNGFADAARWYHFSILPDRWKDPAFAYGGVGMACMLVDDVADRRLDELFWVSVADSIGLTSANKRGAHNGWRARGDQSAILSADDGSIGQNDALGIARRDNGGQPGSYWDLWNTTAGESQTTSAAWLSNRAAAQPMAGELDEGKGTRTGPTGDMLRNWYRTLVFLTGDLTVDFFGRVPNRTDDDITMLNDFVTLPTGTSQPRNVFVWGSGFAEDLSGAGGPAGGTTFLNAFFGASLRSPIYRTFSGNPKQVAGYDPIAGSALDVAGGSFGLSGMKFGVSDGCGLENDVLSVNTAVPTAVAQAQHENVGSNGPYGASIYAPNGGTRAHVSYLDGTRIQRVGGIVSYSPVSGVPVLPVGSAGMRAYVFKVLSLMAGAATCGPQGAPVGVGDQNQNPSGSAFAGFMTLESANPMHSGQARIAFGLAKTDRVEINVYDVMGRLVKRLADRIFVAGQEHVLIWDGTSDAGERVRSGVYFYRLETSTWTSRKKLTVLAN